MEGRIPLGAGRGDVENWWMPVHALRAIYGTIPIGPMNTAPAGGPSTLHPVSVSSRAQPQIQRRRYTTRGCSTWNKAYPSKRSTSRATASPPPRQRLTTPNRFW